MVASISTLRRNGALIPERRPDGAKPRTVRRLGALLATAALAIGLAAPSAVLADNLSVTTQYPEIVVAPGAKVSFNVAVKTSNAERVALTLSGAPEAWKAAIHGGGFVIDAVETNGTDATDVRVDMTVPTDATGTTSMTLTAKESSGGSRELVLRVRVDTNASGGITVTNDIAALRGPSTQSFTFNLTVKNDTTEDQSYSATGNGPTGWTVDATLTGQAQAASAVVKANGSAGVTVAVEPPSEVEAGTYPVQVAVSVGGQTIVKDMTVEITGSYTITMDAANGAPLNARGAAGSGSPFAFTITNTGTAPVTNLKVSASTPTNWEVSFDKAEIASLDAGASETVTATIKPAGAAIAGDYNLTITASGDQSTRDSIDIRYTVETSVIWGIVGGALIVAVFAGVWWVFQRYGRR